MADIHTDFGNGDDTNGDGSALSPWKTLQKAVDVANGGDTIWVGDGGVEILSAPINFTLFGQVQDTNLQNRLVIRGWSFAGGAGVPGWATIDGGSAVAGLTGTERKNYSTFYHLQLQNWDDAGSYAVLRLGQGSLAYEVSVINAQNASTAITSAGVNYGHIIKCRVNGANNGVYGDAFTCLHDNVVINSRNFAVSGGTSTSLRGNICVVQAGHGLYPYGDHAIVENNTCIGSGANNSSGCYIPAGSDNATVISNQFIGFSGTGSYGINNTNANRLAIVGNNYFQDCNENENNVTGNTDVHLSDAGAGPGIVISAAGGTSDAPTAAENATAVHAKLLADEAGTAGSLAERLAVALPNVAHGTLGGLMTGDANNRSAGIQGTVNTLDEVDTAINQVPTASENAAATTAAMDDVYHVKGYRMLRDDSQSRDEHRGIRWFKNDAPVLATDATIQAIDADTGADYIPAGTALTATPGDTALFKYDATGAERIPDGQAYQIHLEATIDGNTRIWEASVGRDN